MIAGGLALLAIPARHWFGITLGRRELLGLGLSAAGLAFLALTADRAPAGAGTEYSSSTMAAFEGVAIVLGAALLLSATRGDGHRHGGLLLGAAAGLLIGVSDVAIKALAEVVPGRPARDPQPLDPGRGDRRRSAPSTRSRARCSSATRSR